MKFIGVSGLAAMQFVLVLFASPAASFASGAVVSASSLGAYLDSNLLNGGGTDDTAVLQAALDKAATGKPVQLLVDGPALVAGLNIYGNTTIECTAGGGLYLKDGSSRAILRNAHRSRTTILDEHIEVRGCFLNGNRLHQPTASITRPDEPPSDMPSNKEKDGTYLSGIQFLGVNYLTIHDVTLWNVRAFGALIANASYVDIHNIFIDHGAGPQAKVEQYINTDGLHFKGPLRYVSIDTVKLRVGDDGIAFSPNDYDTNDLTTRNDFGPYVGQGPITDVTVNNVLLMDSTNGIRILSTNERIDRILISNVIGTVDPYYLLTIGHYKNPSSFGNIGQITLQNLSVDRPAVPPVKLGIIDKMKQNKLLFGEAYGIDMPLVNINGHIESLQIHGLTTQIADSWPLLRIGPEAAVGVLDVEISARDPALQGHILKLEAGGQVGQMNMALSWDGLSNGRCKHPVVDEGGRIDQINWLVDRPCS